MEEISSRHPEYMHNSFLANLSPLSLSPSLPALLVVMCLESHPLLGGRQSLLT